MLNLTTEEKSWIDCWGDEDRELNFPQLSGLNFPQLSGLKNIMVFDIDGKRYATTTNREHLRGVKVSNSVEVGEYDWDSLEKVSHNIRFGASVVMNNVAQNATLPVHSIAPCEPDDEESYCYRVEEGDQGISLVPAQNLGETDLRISQHYWVTEDCYGDEMTLYVPSAGNIDKAVIFRSERAISIVMPMRKQV